MTTTSESLPNEDMALDTIWAHDLDETFAQDRAARVARNAVTSMNIAPAARDPQRLRTYHDTFGISLKPAKTVTNQRTSGRCWMFSTLNVARASTMKALDVDDFEFSQAFGMFYDKLEKANTFLANVIATADLPVDDRTVSLLMEEPAPDGGLFRYASNLITKWGLVPKDVMPETACSKNSREMNAQLDRLLRRDAGILRAKAAKGSEGDELSQERLEMMADIHRMLCTCLGEPPVTFDLECEVGPHADVPTELASEVLPVPDTSEDMGAADKGRRVLRDPGLTPQEFCRRYVGFDADDYVVLISVPGEDRPYGHAYGIRYQDTVAGGAPVRLLNEPMEVLEDAAVASLKAGIPCYMACDVGKNLGRTLDDFPGTLALDGMDTEALFGMSLDMDKATMYDLHESCMTHAMTFQGVEMGPDGRPSAWRVENSWGKDACKDGYLVAAGDWWRLYGAGVVVRRSFVDADVLAAWDEAPLEMQDPWSVLALAVGRHD